MRVRLAESFPNPLSEGFRPVSTLILPQWHSQNRKPIREAKVKEIAFQIYELAFEESSRLNALKERFKFSTARMQVESNIEWLEKVLDLIEINSFTSVQSFIIASATHELAVLTDLKPFPSTSNPTTFYVLFYRTPSPSHPSPFSRIPLPVTPRNHLDNDEWRSTVQSRKTMGAISWVVKQPFLVC